MPGARVGRSCAATASRCGAARADGSYASANDPRVLAGLGDATAVSRIRITWPDGTAEERSDVPIDRWTTIRQGSR